MDGPQYHHLNPQFMEKQKSKNNKVIQLTTKALRTGEFFVSWLFLHTLFNNGGRQKSTYHYPTPTNLYLLPNLLTFLLDVFKYEVKS